MQQGPMDKSMRHQLNIKSGDIVTVTAISTFDTLHQYRHALLFEEYKVSSTPRRSTGEVGYDYRNWMSAVLVPVNKTKRMNEITLDKGFYFTKIQMKVKKKRKRFDDVIVSLARTRMLENINAELNNQPLPLHVPEDAFDKAAWLSLYQKGMVVQAKGMQQGRGWYRAGGTTFYLDEKIEFRVKAEQ